MIRQIAVASLLMAASTCLLAAPLASTQKVIPICRSGDGVEIALKNCSETLDGISLWMSVNPARRVTITTTPQWGFDGASAIDMELAQKVSNEFKRVLQERTASDRPIGTATSDRMGGGWIFLAVDVDDPNDYISGMALSKIAVKTAKEVISILGTAPAAVTTESAHE